MKNKERIEKIILASLIAVALFITGFSIGRIIVDKDIREVNNLIKAYKKYYLYEEDGIVGLIADKLLDQYSDYYTREEYKEVEKYAQGYTYGIGIAVGDEGLNIVNIIGNSPAKKAGIKVGGEVVAINIGDGRKDVSGLDDLGKLINSTQGNEFDIFIKYGEEEIKYTLKASSFLRTYVEFCTVDGYYSFVGDDSAVIVNRDGDGFISDEKVCYLKYSSFNGVQDGLKGSVGQIDYVMKNFSKHNKEYLILDLRGNGGGYLSILSEVASYFVPCSDNSKLLIGKTRYKDGSEDKDYSTASKFSTFGFKKIIVLADNGSASASEVLIGAMLDYNQDDIISVYLYPSYEDGNKVYKTYGKGIMQATYTQMDGAAIKLTVAQLYWPISNTTIHGVGVRKGTAKNVFEVEDEDIQYVIDNIKG